MKATLMRYLTAFFALLAFVGGLGAYLDMLPVEYAKIGGLVLAAVLGLKEIVMIIGDIADDGKRNHSFKPGVNAVLLFLLPAMLGMGLSSCATRPDGTKTFLALDASQWSQVGVAAGKGAVSSGLPVYLSERKEVPSK